MDLPFPNLAIRIDAWLREEGPPLGRPSFVAIRRLLEDEEDRLATAWLAEASSWPAPLRVGFGLACRLADLPLGEAIPLETILAGLPEERLGDISRLLDGFGVVEAARLLTPILGRPGVGAERALWLLAEADASMPLADLPAILQSRIWSQEGRINLLCLVPMVIRSEAAHLCRDLLPSARGDQEIQIQELLALLTTGATIRPTIPRSGRGDPVNPPRATVSVSPPGPLPPSLPPRRMPASTAAPAQKADPLEVPETGLLARIGEAAANLPLLLALTVVLGVFLGYLFWTGAEPGVPAATTRPGEKVWIDAVTRRPITESFLRADKEYRMGEIFRLQGRMQDASGFFRAAAAIDSTHVEALDRLGYCLYKLKSPEAAEEVFQKALKVDPDFYRSHFYLARIYRDSQRWTEALGEFRRAFAGKKDLAQIGLEYLELLIQLGLFEEGRPVAAELVRRFPTNREIAQLQARIAREDR